MDVRISFVFFSLLYQKLKTYEKIMRYKFFIDIIEVDFINLMYIDYFKAIWR